jgi:hypothetical protein
MLTLTDLSYDVQLVTVRMKIINPPFLTLSHSLLYLIYIPLALAHYFL